MERDGQHYDLEALAKITIFLEVLTTLLNPTNSIVRHLLIAAALERLSVELRQKAAELAREKEQS